MLRSASTFWLRLFAAAAALYALMATSAQALGSLRGEAGLVVGALVLCATLALDRLLFAPSWRASSCELGLGAPAARGLLAAAVVCALLIASLPIAARFTGATLALRGDWLWLLPGLLAQAGLAEEVVFRGLVYGRIRATRSYWRATLLSIAPFALVHLAMFATLPWPIATASLALAVILCPPLTHLYELSGRTIWAPALLHATAQGAIKVVEIGGDGASVLPLIWIGACALLPYIVFAWRRPPEAGGAAAA